MFIIVPNEVRDAINAKLDAAFLVCPDAAKDREILYNQLLSDYNENGTIPDFELKKNVS